MYLHTDWSGSPQVKETIASPNRDNGATIGDEFSDLESFFDLAFRTCCNRLLNEHGNTWEVLLDLYLDITARLEGASEHGR